MGAQALPWLSILGSWTFPSNQSGISHAPGRVSKKARGSWGLHSDCKPSVAASGKGWKKQKRNGGKRDFGSSLCLGVQQRGEVWELPSGIANAALLPSLSSFPEVPSAVS